MKKNKVAFQGELGAYSHIAINELFENPEIKTCATFEETFKVAFENEMCYSQENLRHAKANQWRKLRNAQAKKCEGKLRNVKLRNDKSQ